MTVVVYSAARNARERGVHCANNSRVDCFQLLQLHRYITALTGPQIRNRLANGTLQLDLFAEPVCEVEADGVRYVLRNNPDETRRIEHRLEDKLAKLR